MCFSRHRVRKLTIVAHLLNERNTGKWPQLADLSLVLGVSLVELLSLSFAWRWLFLTRVDVGLTSVLRVDLVARSILWVFAVYAAVNLVNVAVQRSDRELALGHLKVCNVEQID